MQCPYLEIEPVARCLAYTDGLRIVRDRELKKSCETIGYEQCPLYKNRVDQDVRWETKDCAQ